MDPYADDAASLALDGLTLENGRDRVALYGTLELTRDRAGLVQARALKAVLDRVVQVLEADPDLPDRVAGPPPQGRARNPFN